MQPKQLEISVAQLPKLLPANWSGESTLAVVIDTLRFTTTAAVALHGGAAAVSVAAEVDAARASAKLLGPETLLCGERHCHRIDGFQLGNSPLEYTPKIVAKRKLVFSTTNGTLAVTASMPAQQILLGSLVNRQAVANWIVASSFSKIWIVCAGTDGQVAAEDVLTAGAIAHACQQRINCILRNDSALIAVELFAQQLSTDEMRMRSRLIQLLSKSAGGFNLIQAGYESDIAEVAKLDTLSVVPMNRSDQPSIFTI